MPMKACAAGSLVAANRIHFAPCTGSFSTPTPAPVSRPNTNCALALWPCSAPTRSHLTDSFSAIWFRICNRSGCMIREIISDFFDSSLPKRTALSSLSAIPTACISEIIPMLVCASGYPASAPRRYHFADSAKFSGTTLPSEYISPSWNIALASPCSAAFLTCTKLE